MPAIWPENEAVAAGLYDAAGSKGAADLKAATDKLRTGMSDLFGAGGLTYNGASTAADGSTRVELGTNVPSVFKDPIGALKSAAAGLTGGSGSNVGTISGTVAGIPVTLDAKSDIGGKVTDYLGGVGVSFEGWIVRIVIMLLGFIFVAVGLSMFGLNNPIGRGVIEGVGDGLRGAAR